MQGPNFFLFKNFTVNMIFKKIFLVFFIFLVFTKNMENKDFFNMLKISLKNIFLVPLSFVLFAKGFSPSGSKYTLKKKSQKKYSQNCDPCSFHDFLRDNFPDIFLSVKSSPRSKNFTIFFPKTLLEMSRYERMNAAYFCLEQNIPEEAIKKFFNFCQKPIDNLKKILLLKPLHKEIKHKKEEEEEEITKQLDKLTNDYFPLQPKEEQHNQDLDVSMESRDPFFAEKENIFSSEKEKIQQATFLFSNRNDNLLAHEQIAKTIYLDVLKIEESRSKALTLAEEKTIPTETKNLTKTHFFLEGYDDDIKILLINKTSVETIASHFHVCVHRIRAFAKLLNIETVKKNNKIKIPKKKMYLLRTMNSDDTQEAKEKRAKELLIHSNLSIEKISSITHMLLSHVVQLAKKWRKRLRKEHNNIPEKKKYLLKDMEANDPLEKREKRVIKLLPYDVPLTKISSITHITPLNIRKLGQKCGIKIKDGKNKFKFSDIEPHLLVKIDKETPSEIKRERARELLMKKVPILVIANITSMCNKTIRKLAKKWNIDVRKHTC